MRTIGATTEDRVPLSQCFYHFGELIVPANTGDPWSDSTQKCLVSSIAGSGRMDALCFRTDYFGVWFGIQVDDYPLDVVHNGHCLQNMGLIGDRADGMPFYLPYFTSPEDLAVASRLPIRFDGELKLWMGNSHDSEAKRCFGLHMYVTGYDIEPVKGNVLDWSLVVPDRRRHTRPSSETIALERHS